MHPGPTLVGDVGDLATRIERARVHVAGLAHTMVGRRARPRPAEGIRLHAALTVRGHTHRPAAAQADQAKRGEDGDVASSPITT